MGTVKSGATAHANHCNRRVRYYLKNPDKILPDGGPEKIIEAALACTSLDDQRRWEREHPVTIRENQRVAYNDTPNKILNLFSIWCERNPRKWRTVHLKKGRKGREVYASGQRERANGVAEYLNKKGIPARAMKLSDGDRKKGRRYIVIEETK
jgi:hypothetical protein